MTARRTRVDWAELIRPLGDVHVPAAAPIVLGLDNRNTDAPVSLSEAFAPAAAKRLWDKLEIHHTPQPGRWLTIAESELSGLGRQGLDRRLPDQATRAAAVAAWTARRNAAHVTVAWQFTTADARIKRKHLYPVLEPVT